MGWESSNVVRFDLGPLLQDRMRIAKLKGAYNSLIIPSRGLACEVLGGCLSVGYNLHWFSDALGRYGTTF